MSEQDSSAGGGKAAPGLDGVAMPIPHIRERLLTQLRPKSGKVIAVRFVEGADSCWSMFVRLSWKSGEYIVSPYSSTKPRRWKSIAKAVEHCRRAYGYFGPIALTTDKEPPCNDS